MIMGLQINALIVAVLKQASHYLMQVTATSCGGKLERLSILQSTIVIYLCVWPFCWKWSCFLASIFIVHSIHSFLCMFQEMYYSILVIPRILWEGNVLALYRWRIYHMFKTVLVNCIYACYMWRQSHRMRGHFISNGIQGWTLFQCRRCHNICLDMKEVLKHLWTHLRHNVYWTQELSTSPAIATMASLILCKRS